MEIVYVYLNIMLSIQILAMRVLLDVYNAIAHQYALFVTLPITSRCSQQYVYAIMDFSSVDYPVYLAHQCQDV